MGSRWREPAFIADVKSRVSKDQFGRFQKMYHEPFFLLGEAEQSGDRVFKVSGSTQTEYAVAVKSDGGFKCSCMDASVNCRKKNCVCKHVCFMVYRVFRFDRIDFLQTHKLTEDEIARVAEFGVTDALSRPAETVFTHRDIDSLCAIMGNVGIGANAITRMRNEIDFTLVKRRPEPGSDCPVCFDELLRHGSDSIVAVSECVRVVGLLGCPSCGNGVHELCARRWLSSAPKKTCVYCRSDVWAKFK